MKAMTGVDLTRLVPRLLEGDEKGSLSSIPPVSETPKSEEIGEEE
jgi:hypothetical protein